MGVLTNEGNHFASAILFTQPPEESENTIFGGNGDDEVVLDIDHKY